MKLHIPEWLLVVVMVIASGGCGPRPVVVDPDDGNTTIIEDDEEVEVVPEQPSAQPETGVDVSVGGGQGVDVSVNPGAAESSKDADQRSNPNATQ